MEGGIPLVHKLDAVTYIGIIFCLLITIYIILKQQIHNVALILLFWYRKLHMLEYGQLLINLCFALMGHKLFAIHSRTMSGLCALAAALLQYFFLVTFMLMASCSILYSITIVQKDNNWITNLNNNWHILQYQIVLVIIYN